MTYNIMEIERFAVNDGPGIRTVIFFKGCPLHCPWCSNPESQSSRTLLMYDKDKCICCGECSKVCMQGAITFSEGCPPVFNRLKCITCGRCGSVCLQKAITYSGTIMSVQDIIKTVLRDFDYYEQSGGGITLSGGEALQQGLKLMPLLTELKEHNLHIAVETCGQFSDKIIKDISPFIDLFLYDIKHTDSEKLNRTTGGSFDLIDRNLSEIIKLNRKVIARIPVIPDFNHSDIEINNILGYCVEKGIKEVDFLPYHNLGKSKYGKLGLVYTLDHKMLTEQDLLPYKYQAEKLGMKASIGG